MGHDQGDHAEPDSKNDPEAVPGGVISMKFEVSPFASEEEKLLEISETLESVKDVLSEMLFDMEDDGKDISTLENALDALEDAIDNMNDAVDDLEEEELELDEEAESEEEEDIEGGIVIDFHIKKKK